MQSELIDEALCCVPAMIRTLREESELDGLPSSPMTGHHPTIRGHGPCVLATHSTAASRDLPHVSDIVSSWLSRVQRESRLAAPSGQS